MLKPLLFAGAAMLAVPVFAQNAPPHEEMTRPVAGETDTMAKQPDADSSASDADDPTEDEATQPDGSRAAASASQISQIIDKDFPTYDVDANGELNQSEFGTWMVALKTSTEPGFITTSAEAQAWLGQAFASADVDKSNAVSKAELTNFLTRGAR